MSKQGTTLAAKGIQAKMEAERKAKIAAARKKIDAEDKIKFAEFERQAAINIKAVKEATESRRRVEEERAREAQAAREREQQRASEPKAPKAPRVKQERRKSDAHADYTFGRKIADDGEFTTAMAKYLRKDASLTWAGVLVEMRKDGVAGGTKRAARLFEAAQREAKANGKAAAKPKAKAKK